MRTVKLKPDLADDEGNLIFEGVIVVKAMKYRDRVQKAKELTLASKINDLKNIKDGADNADYDEAFDVQTKLIEELEGYIESVNVYKKKNKKFIYKSFDDLEYDDDGTRLLNRLAAQVFFSGVDLGNG